MYEMTKIPLKFGFENYNLDAQIPTPMKVSRLIIEEERRWNEEMINDMFREEEAVVVRAIPLSSVSVLGYFDLEGLSISG